MLLAYMMLLAAVIPLPNLNIILPIMQRLDPLFLGFDFRGRDVFTSVEYQRHLFWLNTGELPETLEDIVFRLTPVLNRLNWRGGMQRRRRGGKLNNTKWCWLFYGLENIHVLILWLCSSMSADQQYLILFTALSRLYGAFSQVRLRGRQSLSGIECRVNGVFFQMPWAVSMERLMKFIAPRLSPKLNFIAATAIIMWWIPNW